MADVIAPSGADVAAKVGSAVPRADGALQRRVLLVAEIAARLIARARKTEQEPRQNDEAWGPRDERANSERREIHATPNSNPNPHDPSIADSQVE
jgi:hypothetical protein